MLTFPPFLLNNALADRPFPRADLAYMYDFLQRPGENTQLLIGRDSKKYNLQLGFDSGVDANDPTVYSDGMGFALDDYAYGVAASIPSTLIGDFTAMALVTPGANASTGGTLLSVATLNASAQEYFQLSHSGSTFIGTVRGGATAAVSTAGLSALSGEPCIISFIKSGTTTQIFNETLGTSTAVKTGVVATVPASVAAAFRTCWGALYRNTTISSYFSGRIHWGAFVPNYAFSAEERALGKRFLEKIAAKRGVILP